MSDNKKKLEELTTEDLLKALESAEAPELPEIEVTERTPPVLEFIKRFDLKSGKQPVQPRLLFNLYDRYYPRTATRNRFCELANKILDYDQRYFYLNKDSILLYYEFLKKIPRKKKTSSLNSEASRKHFSAFFENTGIEPGDKRLPWYVFFHIYKSYCIDNKKKNKSADTFKRYLNFHYDSIFSETGPIYLVNEKAANLVEKKDYKALEKTYCPKKENAKRKLSPPGFGKKRKPEN